MPIELRGSGGQGELVAQPRHIRLRHGAAIRDLLLQPQRPTLETSARPSKEGIHGRVGMFLMLIMILMI